MGSRKLEAGFRRIFQKTFYLKGYLLDLEFIKNNLTGQNQVLPLLALVNWPKLLALYLRELDIRIFTFLDFFGLGQLTGGTDKDFQDLLVLLPLKGFRNCQIL